MVNGGVNEHNNIEMGAKLTGGVGECESREGVRGEKMYYLMWKELFQGPSLEPIG
jgi:hypothetical protein